MSTEQQNKFSILLVVTILAVMLAVVAISMQPDSEVTENTLIFPEFNDYVNTINEIRVQSGSGILNLTKQNNIWVVAQADNYPALFTRIRETAIGLGSMRLLAEKTTNPDYYPELGVEDPEAEGTSSSQLTVIDDNGNTLASLIIGNDQHSSSASGRGGQYVRLPDAGPALLVEGNLDVSTEPMDWIDRNLLDIDPERVMKIEFAAPDESYSLQRNDDGRLNLNNIPEGKQARPDYVINRLEGMLDNLRIEGVRADTGTVDPQTGTQTTITTLDGLTVSIYSWAEDGNHFARFQFHYTSAQVAEEVQDTPDSADPGNTANVQEEADALSITTSGWTYLIPAWKFELFTRKLDDLVEDIPQPGEGISEASGG